MKRIKLNFVIISILLCFALSFFTACNFASYNKGTTKEEKEYRESLAQSKNEYIEKLESLSSQDMYFDTEMKTYIMCLVEGRNEINDCESLEEIEDVFEKNAEIIKAIKTIADYEEEENQRQIELQNEKTEYISKLNNVSSMENYRKAEQELFKFYLESGINAINECTDKSPLEKIYLTYKEVIESIKTAKQYETEEAVALEKYKSSKLEEIDKYVDLGDYRKEEREIIENLISEFNESIMASFIYDDIDNFVRDFKIKVYPIKTNSELYEEELSELKENLSLELNNSYKLSLYRENERAIVQDLILSFQTGNENIKEKENVFSQYLIFKNRLDYVKTAKALDEEDRLQLIDNLFVEIKIAIDKNIDEADRNEYLDKAEKVYSEMKDRISLDGVRQEYRAFIEEISLAHGATIDLYKNELNEFNNSITYRDKEKGEVNLLKEQYLVKFTEDLEISKVKALLQEAKNAINQIKTNDQLWDDSVQEFRNKLLELYGNAVLQEPESFTEAKDYYELANIVDYYAFYQVSGTAFVCDNFRVKLNFDHDDAETEINNFYWNCELLRSGVGINGWIEDNHFLVLKLIPYKLATTSNLDSTEKGDRYNSLISFNSDKSDMLTREESFNSFPYMKNTKYIAGVWNSQQLWYALEHEYVPICEPDSPADILLSRAKEILRGIILEGMSDEEKIFQIYSWFAQNVQYDHQYTNDFYQSVLEKYPEAAASKAFHAEGAIIDGLAVCEGYAKGYLLLLRMEGIESYRIVQSSSLKGHIISNPSGNKVFYVGYKSHAFVAVKMSDGKLYYSDSENSFVTGSESLQQYQQCLVPPELYDGYTGKIYFSPDIEFATEISNFYDHLIIGNKKLFIENKDELSQIIDLFSNLKNTQEHIQLSVFCDAKKYLNVQNDLDDLLFDIDYKKKSSGNSISIFTEFILYQ